MNAQEQTTLAAQLRQGAVVPEAATAIATTLAQALRHFHEEGSVFGNLTPDTIQIEDGAIALLPEARQESLTPYSSPELASGSVIDTRSDIYSFGVIVYELLGGRPPAALEERNQDALRVAILEWEPQPLAHVSPTLERLVGRCLAKDSARRWQRIGAVLTELKLAGTAAHYAQRAPEWKVMVASLRSQMDALGERIDGQRAVQEAAAAGLRESLMALETKAAEHQARAAAAVEAIEEVRNSVSKLERLVQSQGRAIQAVEAAVSQTDEVMVHVVEAFDQMHKSIVEHGEPRAISVSSEN